MVVFVGVNVSVAIADVGGERRTEEPSESICGADANGRVAMVVL